MEAERIGLVFAGGGGKGSYEIGVWRYLHETGLDRQVAAVSGTSVGALNAALFVGSSYEDAFNLWNTITPDMILADKYEAGGKNSERARWIKTVMKQAFFPPWGAYAYLKLMRSEYFFSRSGLEKLIDSGLNMEKLKSSRVSCYATCYRTSRPRGIQRFKLNDCEPDEVKTILLASSAIPVVFPKERLEGKEYCDGGVPVVGDNLPIQPIYDEGIRKILVVGLNPDVTIDEKRYPGAKIHLIAPKKDLGNAIHGALDFTNEGIYKRLLQGYEDARGFQG